MPTMPLPGGNGAPGVVSAVLCEWRGGFAMRVLWAMDRPLVPAGAVVVIAAAGQ